MDKIYLRKTKPSDIDIYYAWRNEDEVRKNSFTENWIKYADHEKWFINALNDHSEELWIMCLNDERIGQIRLSYENYTAHINYSITREYRGQGYGEMILRLLENEIFDREPSIKLIGEVKKNNIASQLTFMSCNYAKIEKEDIICFEKFPEKQIIENKCHKFLGGGGVIFLTNNINTLNTFYWLSERVYATLISSVIDLSLVRKICPKLILSYNYAHIISKDVIDFLPHRIINLHISLLPYNRGSDPNIWSFLENTPKGVTIHEIDAGLDTGSIICQKEVFFDETKETLATSYNKLQYEIVKLLKENWDNIFNGKYKVFQPTIRGSYHNKKDLEKFLAGKTLDYDEIIADWKR